MEGFLSKKDAEGKVKELFKEWEWKKRDGTTVAWDAFCKTPIVQSMTDANATEMHLYPVTHRLNALDQKGDTVRRLQPGVADRPEALASDVADSTPPTRSLR